jgi:hypothetical protein
VADVPSGLSLTPPQETKQSDTVNNVTLIAMNIVPASLRNGEGVTLSATLKMEAARSSET